MIDIIKELQKFYKMQCNEEWEHGYRIHIDTIDNPGWSVFISIEDTSLANKKFFPICEERNEDDWIICDIKKNCFEGYGGAENLYEILSIFLSWYNSINDIEKQ